MFLNPATGKAPARMSSWTYVHNGMNRQSPESATKMADATTFKASSEALINAKKSSMQSVNIQNPKFLAGARKVMEFMYQSWINNKLCDMVIHVDSGKLNAHKIVLCAYSSAIEKECECYPKENIVFLDLREFSKDVVLELLYFIYTTNINIHDGNLKGLVQLSTELDITTLVELCHEQLSKFNVSNALSYFDIAEEMGLPVTEHIQKYVCENFIDVVNGKEFLSLPQEKLSKIVQDDRVHNISELDVFLAVVRWINHDTENRLPLAPVLLQNVRFNKIEPETIVNQVEIYIEIFELRECHDMLYEAMKYHALKLSGSPLAYRRGSSSFNRERRPSAPTQLQSMRSPLARVQAPRALTIGKSSGVRQNMTTTTTKQHFVQHTNGETQYVSMPNQGEFNSLTNTLRMDIQPQQPQQPQVYNVQNEYIVQPQVNTSNSPMPIYPSGVSSSIESITREQKLFPSLVVVCIGGIDVRSTNKDYPGRCIYRYDDKVNDWNILTMMSAYTHHHTSAAIAGKLYVIGGTLENRSNPDVTGVATNTVQLFDTETGLWSTASPMMQPRRYITAGVHKHNIYVAGGEGENNMYLDTVEKYEATFDKWVFVARMMGGPKIGTAVCVYKNFVYIVGGYNSDRPDGPALTDVECYDIARQKWVERNPLKVARCHANLVVANNKMYLIGGRTQTFVAGTKEVHGHIMTSMSSIAVYDDARDVWMHISDMMTPRLDCGCTAIGSKIFIIGGMATPDPTCLDIVECFDTVTNMWIENISPLPQPAAGTSCVTL